MMMNKIFAVAVAGICAGFMSAGAQAAEMETLALVERATTDVVTDTGAAGDSPGDILTYANEMFDKDNATKVGDDNGWCVRVVAGKSWECFFTLILADGQITVEGPFYDGKDSVMAITGGTGKYVGITGEMKLHARNPEGTEYDFTYGYVLDD
ncbi:MAG: allene oxide cyclase family protein [Dongiaceae bacterium]